MECIRMIGYDAVHPSDFVYDVPKEHGYYLLILTHTPVRFRDGDGERIYPARHAALFSPDSRIHYSACEETYSNDWIIFSSDEAYVTQFPLQNRPFPAPDADYCHNLFQLLTWEHMQSSNETVASQLLALLFRKLCAGMELPGDADYQLELAALRRRIMSQPERNRSAARQDRLSRSSLYASFSRPERGFRSVSEAGHYMIQVRSAAPVLPLPGFFCSRQASASCRQWR